VVPFDKKFVDKNKHIRVREVTHVTEFGDKVILETKDMMCPYLSKEYKCTIYNERPEVCRLFGNETHPLLVCPYQDKNGKIRSRQERRNIERENGKHFDHNYKKWINKTNNQ